MKKIYVVTMLFLSILANQSAANPAERKRLEEGYTQNLKAIGVLTQIAHNLPYG